MQFLKDGVQTVAASDCYSGILRNNKGCNSTPCSYFIDSIRDLVTEHEGYAQFSRLAIPILKLVIHVLCHPYRTAKPLISCKKDGKFIYLMCNFLIMLIIWHLSFAHEHQT